MRVKFGIMAYPGFNFCPPEGFKFEFGSNVHFVVEPVKKTFNKFEGKHWAKWLGDIKWDDFVSSKVQIQIWMSSNTPEVSDQENVDIANTLYRCAVVPRRLKMENLFARRQLKLESGFESMI